MDRKNLTNRRKPKINSRPRGIVLQLVCILLLFNLYNPISQVFGIEHQRGAYVAYCLVLAVIAVVSWLICLAKGVKYTPFCIVMIFVVALFTLAAFSIWHFGWYESDTLASFCTFFIVFALPSMLAGLCLFNCNRVKTLIKWFDFVGIILILCALSYVIFGSGFSITDSGVGYQGVSYSAALALGIFLFFILFDVDHERFHFAQTKVYKAIQYVLVPVAFVLSFASGGRGGGVLALVFALIATIVAIRRQKSRSKYFKILAVALIATLIFFTFGDTSVVDDGLARFSELFANDALTDTSKSATNSISTRNVLYQNAFSLISESPLYGYGFFSYVDVQGFYPHNIFLEIMLQGGILYLAIFALLVVLAIGAWRKAVQVNGELIMFVPIAVYSFVMFLFSGSYSFNTTFWFLVGMTLVFSQYNSSENKWCRKKKLRQ